MLAISQTVPNFSFQATNGITASLADYQGQHVIFYFYPKDATPGCTVEAQNFRDHIDQFKALNTVIFGVSRDSVRSHEKFKEKQNLPFELISDPDETLCELFGVMKEKSMFGKKYMGIDRSTFIVNPEGKLIYEQRQVKVKGHVATLLQFLQQG